MNMRKMEFKGDAMATNITQLCDVWLHWCWVMQILNLNRLWYSVNEAELSEKFKKNIKKLFEYYVDSITLFGQFYKTMKQHVRLNWEFSIGIWILNFPGFPKAFSKFQSRILQGYLKFLNFYDRENFSHGGNCSKFRWWGVGKEGY